MTKRMHYNDQHHGAKNVEAIHIAWSISYRVTLKHHTDTSTPYLLRNKRACQAMTTLTWITNAPQETKSPPTTTLAQIYNTIPKAMKCLPQAIKGQFSLQPLQECLVPCLSTIGIKRSLEHQATSLRFPHLRLL